VKFREYCFHLVFLETVEKSKKQADLNEPLTANPILLPTLLQEWQRQSGSAMKVTSNTKNSASERVQ